jgi:hypothetical protein
VGARGIDLYSAGGPNPDLPGLRPAPTPVSRPAPPRRITRRSQGIDPP